MGRAGWAEPEVVFRVVHVALDDGPSSTDAWPPTPDRDQTVDVALGPNPNFPKGGVAALTRRVPHGQVVNAVPSSRRKAGPPRRPKPAGPPRIVETLRKAIKWRRQLDAGEIPNQAAIARREGVTRARVTQVLGLLRLPEETRNRILAMSETVLRTTMSERVLRPIAQMRDPEAQMAEFAVLCTRVA